MAAGVHAAADVAVLAQSMGLIAQALPKTPTKQPGVRDELAILRGKLSPDDVREIEEIFHAGQADALTIAMQSQKRDWFWQKRERVVFANELIKSQKKLFERRKKILLEEPVDGPEFIPTFDALMQEVGTSSWIVGSGDQEETRALRDIIESYLRADLEAFRKYVSDPMQLLLIDAAIRQKKHAREKKRSMASKKSMPEVAPGGLLPGERDEYFALAKQIGDMREQLKNVTRDIEQYVYNPDDKQEHMQIVTRPWVDTIYWNPRNLEHWQEEQDKNQLFSPYIELIKKVRNFIRKDRGMRMIEVLFSYGNQGDGAMFYEVLAKGLLDSVPVLLNQNALSNFLERYHSVDTESWFKELFREWFLDGDNPGDFPSEFYQRCVRYNTQFGWFLMLPVDRHQTTDLIAQQLGLTLDSNWVVVNSLEHAHKLAGNKTPLPLSCVPLMEKLLKTEYWWDLILTAHGAENFSMTCEMRPEEFKELLEDLSDSAISIARIVVVTCYGGSKEILQKVYGNERFSFDIVFPNTTEFVLVTDAAPWRDLFFYIANPSFPAISISVEQRHNAMLIRHKNADHFELFDPWNKRAQEPGLRPDIKGTYAPAVPWRRGMKPEEIHPGARATA